MSDETSIPQTNEVPTTTTRGGDDTGGDFVIYLVLDTRGQERSVLISTSYFESLDEIEEDDNASEDNETDSNFDSDLDEYVLDDTAPKVRPASRTAIEGLEKVKIDEGLHCSVCLEELWHELDARRLRCAHVYHASYIMEWLEKSNMCPLCRHKLPVVDFDLNLNMPSS